MHGIGGACEIDRNLYLVRFIVTIRMRFGAVLLYFKTHRWPKEHIIRGGAVIIKAHRWPKEQ